MNCKIPHLYKLVLFVTLNLADAYLTWRLLEDSGGQVYESNPLAGWWLNAFGWLGVLLYKGSVVLLVLAIILLIASSRPRTASKVLTFACSVLALVVLYSCAVAGWVNSTRSEVPSDELILIEETRQGIERERAISWDYSRQLSFLSEEVMARRLTLEEATQHLARTEKGHDPAWLKLLHDIYPGYSDQECVAANLMENVVATRKAHPSEVVPLVHRLNADFRELFGLPSPCRYTAVFGYEGPPKSRRTGQIISAQFQSHVVTPSPSLVGTDGSTASGPTIFPKALLSPKQRTLNRGLKVGCVFRLKRLHPFLKCPDIET